MLGCPRCSPTTSRASQRRRRCRVRYLHDHSGAYGEGGIAGPYYESGDAIMVRAGNADIHSVGDLNGKTVATEASSTAVLALQKAAPGANALLFQEDAQCVAAVQQGRAHAYVLDQGILISDASTNPAVKVVGAPFTHKPYGIGLPLGDPTAKQFVNDWLRKIYAEGSWTKLWKATIGTVVKGHAPAPPPIGSVADPEPSREARASTLSSTISPSCWAACSSPLS
jgi:hypothetical protein